MEHSDKTHNDSSANKAAPQNIAGKNEEQAKQMTEPLDAHSSTPADRREGNMDNGELGAGITKED